MTELELVFSHLEYASCPEDIFGLVPSAMSSVFKHLAKAVHPDYNTDKVLATKAFQLLTEINREGEKRIADKTYGKKILFDWCIPVSIGKYKVNKTPIKGSIADLYKVEMKDILVKVARSHDDNDLMQAEAEALTILKKIPSPILSGIPEIIESFKISGKWRRNVNVISRCTNFHSLEDVRKNQEIDHKTSVWIFKRMLSLLGWVHHLGIIHGSVLPCHVLVYPDNDGEAHSDPKQHTVRLIDWCYSVNKSRTKLSAWLPEYESFYAPEVLDKKVSPSVDLYMTARMIKSLTVADFPEPLEKVLSRCLDKDPTKRYLNSSEVFDAWERAAFESYGAPKWHDFIMKGI